MLDREQIEQDLALLHKMVQDNIKVVNQAKNSKPLSKNQAAHKKATIELYKAVGNYRGRYNNCSDDHQCMLLRGEADKCRDKVNNLIVARELLDGATKDQVRSLLKSIHGGRPSVPESKTIPVAVLPVASTISARISARLGKIRAGFRSYMRVLFRTNSIEKQESLMQPQPSEAPRSNPIPIRGGYFTSSTTYYGSPCSSLKDTPATGLFSQSPSGISVSSLSESLSSSFQSKFR